MIFTVFQAHSAHRWQLHRETAVSSLSTIQVQSDLLHRWCRMVEALEETDGDTDEVMMEKEPPQDLSRLSPDAFAILWSKR